MSLDAIRVAVVTAVESAKATFAGGYPLVIEYDNKIVVDTKTQVNPFLCVRTLMLDGFQVDISNNPLQRVTGQIHLGAAIPKGDGSAKALQLLDHFGPRLHRKTLGVVRTLMSEPGKPVEHEDWVYYTLLVPFWSDQTT